MAWEIGEIKKLYQIENSDIVAKRAVTCLLYLFQICSCNFRVDPKISNRFKTSVEQFNVFLTKTKHAKPFNFDEENLNILRLSLNKIFKNVKEINKDNSRAVFQMNISLKSKIC